MVFNSFDVPVEFETLLCQLRTLQNERVERQNWISDSNLLSSFIHQKGMIWWLISTGHEPESRFFFASQCNDAVLPQIREQMSGPEIS